METRRLRRKICMMKAVSHLSVVLLTALLLVSSTTAIAQETSKKYALLIAVNRYKDATLDETKLKFPEVDAAKLGLFLENSGYNVEYLLGSAATKDAIESKINAMSGKSDANGVAIIGLWGHGVEFAGTNETLFCPYDAEVRFVKDDDGKELLDERGKHLIEPAPESLIGLSKLLGGLVISGAGNRILLADCCRNAPNAPRGRAFGGNVTSADLPDNTLAILACKANEKAYEHEQWRHGAMTRALLDTLPLLRDGNSDAALNLIDPMTNQVSEMVRRITNGRSTQTIHQISNGNPRLKLASRSPEITLLPIGQSLSDAEKAERRAKAERELPNLGDESQTAFIRGMLYGPSSLKFKLKNRYDEDEDDVYRRDLDTYFRELETLRTDKHADLYWAQAQKLRDWLRYGGKFDNDLARDLLLKPDKSHVLASFRRHDLFQLVPEMIRPLLALTTLQERRDVLRRAILDLPFGESQEEDASSYTDKAIMLACTEELHLLNGENISYSHGPYLVVPYALQNRIPEAMAALEKLENLELRLRPSGLLLLCENLLDQGYSEEAKEIFNRSDKSANYLNGNEPIVLYVGNLPRPATNFHTGGSGFIDSFATYIAGRLNDEQAYSEQRKSAGTAINEKDRRRTFIEGLVRDL